jgi:hypothetical protein
MAQIEPVPSLGGGDTETVGRKLKNRNSFSKPNFEPLPKPRQVRLYQISKNSSGRVYEELLLEKGVYPG